MLGFLSPEGVFYKCGYAEHLPKADTLLDKFYGKWSNNPVDKLCSLGWIVIQKEFVGFSCSDLHKAPQITRQQMEWLEDNRDRFTGLQERSLKICLEVNQILYS